MVLLGSMMAVGPLSTDMYLPAFPTIEREFGAASGSLQITFAAYFVGMALGQAFYGPISDRFGRKSCLYFGLSLFIVAALGCASSNDVGELSAWRLLQGIGGCSPMVITLAIIRDRVTGAEAARTFSRLLLVMGVAPIIAPLLGGWLLTAFGWQAIFVLLATMAATSLVLMHFFLPETLDPANAAIAPPQESGHELRRPAQGPLVHGPRADWRHCDQRHVRLYRCFALCVHRNSRHRSQQLRLVFRGQCHRVHWRQSDQCLAGYPVRFRTHHPPFRHHAGLCRLCPCGVGAGGMVAVTAAGHLLFCVHWQSRIHHIRTRCHSHCPDRVTAPARHPH